MDFKKFDRNSLIIAYIAIGISIIASLYCGVYLIGIKYMIGFLGTHIGAIEILKMLAMLFVGMMVSGTMSFILFMLIAIVRVECVDYICKHRTKNQRGKVINMEEYLKSR